MYKDQKQNPLIKSLHSFHDSEISAGKYSLKESQLLGKIQEPISLKLVKEYSYPGHHSQQANKIKPMKLKKIQSLQTNTTEEQGILQQERMFVTRYKNDVFFQKRVDALMREHEKRYRNGEKVQVSLEEKNSFRASTWRDLKDTQESRMVKLYQKCKKWISKAHNDQ